MSSTNLASPQGLGSRLEIAHRSHARASEHVFQLATKLDVAFAELDQAAERLAAEGVHAEIDLPEWLAQGRASWRTARDYTPPNWRAERHQAAAEQGLLASVLDPRD